MRIVQVCADWAQYVLLEDWLQRADDGAPGYERLLTLTPCDMWPLLQGRTLWVVGDSISQVKFRAATCCHIEHCILGPSPYLGNAKSCISMCCWLGCSEC